MDTVVRVLAGIFLANVVILACFGLVLEVRRRRGQREVRELELLYEAPPFSLGRRAAARGGRRWSIGKRVAVPDRRRHGILGTLPLVLAVASIGMVVATAVVAPVDRPGERTSAAGRGNTTNGSDLGPTVRPTPSTGSEPARSPIDNPAEGFAAIDEPTDPEAPGMNVVVSGGQEAVPAVLAAAPASSTSILIAWEPVPDAIGYRVDRRTEDGSAASEGWSTIAETAASVSSHTDTGLHAGTTYSYRVAAVLGAGEVAPTSDPVFATTPPEAPTLAVEVAGNKVRLSWTDVADETGYRIERLVAGGTEWLPIASTGEGIVTTQDKDVVEAMSYQYRVVATGLGGDSEASNVVEVVGPGPDGGGGTPVSEVPQPDAGTQDAGTQDAIAPDTGAQDAMAPDAGTHEAIAPDTGAQDAIAPETSTRGAMALGTGASVSVDPNAVGADAVNLDAAPVSSG